MSMLGMYCWLASRVATLRSEHERGAAAVEYGLLVGLIAAFIVGAVAAIGGKVQGAFCFVANTLPGGPVDCPS